MSLHQRCFLTICALSIAITFPACNPATKAPPPATPSALQITLSVGPNNSCLQNGILGGNAVIGTDGVTWVGPTSTTSIAVTFSTCPFSTCSFSSAAGGGSVSSGAASGTSGTSYAYSSITIGGSQCSVGTDGIVMR